MGVREKYLYYNRKYFTIRHLDRLHEGVEENSDTNRPTQEFDKSGCTEESEEADLDYSSGVYDTTSHSDEVKGIP